MESRTPVTPQPTDTSSHRCRFGGHGARRRGLFAVIVIAVIAGLAGGYIGKSFAHGFGGGHGHMGFGAADPAKMDEHVERMVRHFAVEVDATPAQREKLTTIAKAAARDLRPLREKHAAAHKEAIDLIGSAHVDRAAIEKLRGEQMQLADTATRRVTQALADVADVLTPAQREKIAARMKEHVERMERMHRG